MRLMRWFGKRAEVSEKDQARLYALPGPEPLGEQLLAQQRFVVVDLEATGLNIHKDLILSIGAVAIENSSVVISQQLSRTLKRKIGKMTESVLIHQISPSEIAAGMRPETALLDFLEFVGNSPLLAFHADFDQGLLVREFRDIFSFAFKHPFFDLAEIAPMLFPDHGMRDPRMDEWVEFFGLQVLQRHNAFADAMATAELMLVLLKKAESQGIKTLKDLELALVNWRRRQTRQTSL